MTTEQTASMTAAIQRASRAIAAGNKARRLAIRLEQAHAEALIEGAAMRYRLRLQVEDDHAAALLDNLPCELCGQVEVSPKHRGIGHTHTPAEDPRGRARALLGRMGGDLRMAIPDYVYETAHMMVDPGHTTAWVVGLDHAAALRENRAVTEVAAYLTDMGDDVLTRPVSPFTDTRDLGHPAEPHSRQPGVCRTCRRPIHIRTDDQGGFVSAAHHA